MIVPLIALSVGFSVGALFGAWWATRPSARQRHSRIRSMDERTPVRRMERGL